VISLRAGDTFIEISHVPSAAILQFGFMRSTNEAGTAFTGGIRATANDANGLRYLITTPTTANVDAVRGGVAQASTSAKRSLFAITADYQAGIVSTDTAVRDMFYAGRSHRRRVVVR
jgi:hypothetical protein